MGETLSGQTPQVVAHRGSSDAYPEHTLPAYLRAIDEGADAVECDVRLTADRELVCVHDRRVNRTSDGHGVVSELELADLVELDFGSWKGPTAAYVLTLRELLAAVRGAGRRVDIAIETKHPNKYGGGLEQALVDLLEEEGLIDPGPADPQARMMSFSVLAVRRVRRLAPTLPRVLLSELGLNPGVRAGQLPDGVSIVGISTSLLKRDPAIVVRHHQHGHEVHCYTANTVEDIDLCLSTGIDAIITNRPAAVRAAVDSLGS